MKLQNMLPVMIKKPSPAKMLSSLKKGYRGSDSISPKTRQRHVLDKAQGIAGTTNFFQCPALSDDLTTGPYVTTDYPA